MGLLFAVCSYPGSFIFKFLFLTKYIKCRNKFKNRLGREKWKKKKLALIYNNNSQIFNDFNNFPVSRLFFNL